MRKKQMLVGVRSLAWLDKLSWEATRLLYLGDLRVNEGREQGRECLPAAAPFGEDSRTL